MATVATLVVELSGNVARLHKDMKQANRTVASSMAGIKRDVDSAKRALGAFGLAIGAVGLVRLIKGALGAQDELSKLSQKVGISVEGLVGLKHAASLSGLSFEGLQKSIKTVSTQMFDASMGLAESKRNFAALGIEIKGTDGTLKSAEAVIVEVADKFAALEDGTNKTALAVKLFGKAGLDMIPMLNQGSAAMAKLVSEGQALNPVTAESARQAELLNDSLEVLTKSFTRYGTSLLNDVLPVTSELAEMMSENALAGALKKSREEAAGLDKQFKILPETFKVATILGGNVSFVLKGIGRDLGGMVAQLAALGRGDFEGFKVIREELVKDGKAARAELAEWEARIMALGTARGARPSRGRGASVTTEDESAAKARDAERKKILDDHVRLIEFEQQVQDEANEATNEFYRKRQDKRDADLQRQREASDELRELLSAPYVEAAEAAREAADGLVYTWNAAGERVVMTLEKWDAAQDKLKDGARELGFTFSSAFEDAAIEGKKLSEVIRGLGHDIARIILRKSITEPLVGAIAGAISKSGIGGLFGGSGGSSGAFGIGVAGFAEGTDFVPRDGLAYLHKGEAVVPALDNAGGGRGGAGVTNIFNVDMRGASVEAVARLERLVARLHGSIEQRAIGAMRGARARGIA